MRWKLNKIKLVSSNTVLIIGSKYVHQSVVPNLLFKEEEMFWPRVPCPPRYFQPHLGLTQGFFLQYLGRMTCEKWAEAGIRNSADFRRTFCGRQVHCIWPLLCVTFGARLGGWVPPTLISCQQDKHYSNSNSAISLPSRHEKRPKMFANQI